MYMSNFSAQTQLFRVSMCHFYLPILIICQWCDEKCWLGSIFANLK
ncbi:hypothetical protein DICVIV_07483 [Dictyocaulus viviparus]|uniref:Uncharacterized protein n=1 Tax=Dictyocaulus viviparus TaxID=29172 RepID=A0A0D8XP85_DICVI|nr:hypothetical protein DICVIV_07483 [Dictyocaulus viviparus]